MYLVGYPGMYRWRRRRQVNLPGVVPGYVHAVTQVGEGEDQYMYLVGYPDMYML